MTELNEDDDFPEGLENEPEYELGIPDNESKEDKIKAISEKLRSDDVKEEKKEEKKQEKKQYKPYKKGRLDFEDAKQWLIDNQYVEYEDPDQKYCEITIPTTVTMGEDLVIKLSNKVTKVHYLFGDGYSWKKTSVYDPKSEYDIQLRPTIDEDKKKFNDNEIKIPIGSIKTINKVKYEMWLEGYYLCVVRAYANEWHEDTVVKRMVKVVAK